MDKLTDEAKALIKYIPEAVNQLAEKLCGAFDNAVLYGTKPITNADRIRAMSDEELAVILSVLTQDAFYSMSVGNTHITRARFADYHTALEWLKQEVYNEHID